MTEQSASRLCLIPNFKVHELVEFETVNGQWRVKHVRCDISGDVYGNVQNVHGKVKGTINGRRWEYVESPEEEILRLARFSDNEELTAALNNYFDNK